MSVLDAAKTVTKGQVLRYMFMPQVVPRINAFYQTGFSYLAYMIALVYRAVNILPPDHRVFSPEYQNRLGIRMVLGAAAAELKFSKSHIDQIIIYFAVLIGLVMLAGQFFLMLSFLMLNPAMAGGGMPTTYAGFFATPDYQNDIAYNMLFAVFGVPEIFRGDAGAARGPFHIALHSLFQFYSIGLLIVAVLITCYLIFAIVIETAQTGVPFGKRYNHVWAPIRFVVALGLLIPMGYGLNAAQWITLYAAKFGSDFATRGWVIFNDVMTEEYLSNPLERVGVPQAPELNATLAFMMTVEACKFGYEAIWWRAPLGGDNRTIEAYLIKSTAEQGGNPLLLSEVTYPAAKAYFNNGDILIRFGEHNPETFKKWRGEVFPYCGDITISAGDANDPGSAFIQQYYLTLISNMFYNSAFIGLYGQSFMRKYSEIEAIKDLDPPMPTVDYKGTMAAQMAQGLNAAIVEAAILQAGDEEAWAKQAAEVSSLGWGAAGVWYNKIAQLNGSLVNSVAAIPQVRSMPFVMEYIKKEQLQQNTFVPSAYKLTLSDGQEINISATESKIARALSEINDFWTKEDTRQDAQGSQTKRTSNIFIDTINMVFGTRGLFNMCQNADVHPLAQLSILGKGLIESSIRNLAIAMGFGVMTMANVPFLGVAAGAASSMLLSIATVTITLGFMLFYVLPFMPFLYFFFAVGGWVKGLFEAMVGVPLWALAHLRIDGEGLPSDAAISGYYLIFEIFLRPILILFGLLASVIIFAAMVKVLNQIFTLVVINLSGHDSVAGSICGNPTGATPPTAGEDPTAYYRGPVDELFYTVIYAVIVYMIGMSCFKLIDLVPNNILRYMNASVNTFNDQAGDPSQNLMRNLSIGTSQISGQVVQMGKQLGDAGSNTIKAVGEFAGPQK